MAQVASSFGSSKNQLVSSAIALASGSTYGAVTALGPSGSSAVGSIIVPASSFRISSINMMINNTALQTNQTSIWPFTVYFFNAAPTINGLAAWAWQYTWASSYLGGISLIGASNAQTGATGSVYTSVLGFGAGTQPGIGGQALDVVLGSGTTGNTLYFVAVTNYTISSQFSGGTTLTLSLNVSTL